MKQNYNAGLANNTLLLEVTVGTPVTAYTAVYRIQGEQDELIKESNVQSGNIPSFSPGTAAVLKNNGLVIETDISFANVPAANRQNLVNTLKISYKLSGGFDGIKIFNPDPDDIVAKPGNAGAVVTKSIAIL